MRLDEKLAANLPVDHAERTARMLLQKYCVPRGVSRMIEPARDPGEAWWILESYFGRQTRALDELISDILS